MLKKLKKKDGATMALALVIAVVITAVSIAISALIATVAINQVNASKKSFSYLDLENEMYIALNDSYENPNLKNLLKFTSASSVKVIGENSHKSTLSYEKADGTLGYYEYQFNHEVSTVYIKYIDIRTNAQYCLISKEDSGKYQVSICPIDLQDGSQEFETGVVGTRLVRMKVDFSNAYTYQILEKENTTWSGNFNFSI